MTQDAQVPEVQPGGMQAWAGTGLPIVTADGRAGEVI